MIDQIPAHFLKDQSDPPDFEDLPDIDRQTYMYVVKVLDKFAPDEIAEPPKDGVYMMPSPVLVDRKRRFKRALLKKVTVFPKQKSNEKSTRAH